MCNLWLRSLFLAILFSISIIAQESKKFSPEEFFDQYQKALEEKNEEKAKQLVEENKEVAKLVAENLFNQAMKAYEKTDYEKAAKKFAISGLLYLQIGKKETVVKILNCGGLSHYNSQNYQRALQLYDYALKISKELEGSPLEGQLLYNIAGAYRKIKNYQNALKYLEEALKIFRATNNKAGEVMTLNTLAEIYCNNPISELPDSIKHCQQVLKYCEEARNANQGRDKAEESRSLEYMGLVYYDSADYEKALQYYTDALNLAEEKFNYSALKVQRMISD